MAQRKDTTNFSGLLFHFMGTEDPMLNMLEWLCEQMMEVEVSNKIGADSRSGYLFGCKHFFPTIWKADAR